MGCMEPDEDGHINIHLLFSKLPFFCPYDIVLLKFSKGSHVNEPTIRAARGGNDD